MFLYLKTIFIGRDYDGFIAKKYNNSWYVSYYLSYRQVGELLEEVDRATIHRWIVEYRPKLLKNFYKLRRSIWGCWRMNETYIKVKGVWCYLGNLL